MATGNLRHVNEVDCVLEFDGEIAVADASFFVLFAMADADRAALRCLVR